MHIRILLVAMLAAGVCASSFRTSQGDEFDKLLNRMWEVYGIVCDGAVYKFGNEPTYFEWMALKIAWCDDEDFKKGLVERIREFPMSSDGYMWSWGEDPRWPPGHALHFANNAKYILGACRYFFWTGDEDFLHSKDTTRVNEQDASAGLSVLEKLRRAMEYQLEVLHGKEGLLRIENGENTGKRGGKPSNYWDNFPMGYYDAYSNIYYYASLLAMAELEEFLGNKERASFLRKTAKLCKEEFTHLFWDDRKGRFIGCVDIDGGRWDLGFTFVNTEAISYGLADKGQAQLVYRWLDGERIVEGDFSTGGDIYYFKIAPRSTTIPVESLGTPFWWESLEGAIMPNTNASYGTHLENGGAIFYTSFYDMLGRIRMGDPDSAFARWSVILEEFKKDELRRDPTNSFGAPWVIGVIGEFPESGLVPTIFVHGFGGLQAHPDYLAISPQLPDQLKWVEIENVVYHGVPLKVRVSKQEIAITALKAFSEPLEFAFNLKNRFYLVKKGDCLPEKMSGDKSGWLHVKTKLLEGEKLLVRRRGR